MPSYYTDESEPRRSGLSSSTSRHENEVARLKDCCESFLNADKLESFDVLMSKIAEELTRQKYLTKLIVEHTYVGHFYPAIAVK